MALGILLISQGTLILLLLNPKKLPIKIKGAVQKIHNTKRERMSWKLTAAFDFSIVKIILTMIYPKIKVPGNKKEVRHETLSQFTPPQKR